MRTSQPMKTLLQRLARSAVMVASLVGLAAPAMAAGTPSLGLTVQSTTVTLPDGQSVPMWGYFCDPGVTPALGVTCAAANANAGTSWSPVVITVDLGKFSLSSSNPFTVQLTNQLSFAYAGGANAIPTSLTFVGQVGGGLGSPKMVGSPAHAVQGTTWSVVGAGPTNQPPQQPDRVQSFGTEVTVGAPQNLSWTTLRPGTYLLQSGTHPSIQVPMGLYGVLIVLPAQTNANGARSAYTSTGPATAATAAASAFDADLPVVLSEIDPVQNTAVDLAVKTSTFDENRPWTGLPSTTASGSTPGCGDPSVHTCYPPTVNYSPRYYLVNGVSFDRSHVAASTSNLLTSTSPVSGNLLLRYVNAGLRMHVPSLVGLPEAIVSEDGNLLPGQPRLQNEVFLAAGKTADAVVSPVQSSGAYQPATYPLFDRQLSLTTNSQLDGGMQAYLAVAGGTSNFAAKVGTSLANAKDKSYFCQAGVTLAVSDPSLGVLGGVTGANGATLQSQSLGAGTLAFNNNGTFTYVPPASTCGGSFTFSINGGAAVQTAHIYECDVTVQNGPANGNCVLSGQPVIKNDSFATNNAVQMAIAAPGVLANDFDPSGLALKATLASADPNLTVKLNPDGSFTATAKTAGQYNFWYTVVNAQGTAGSNADPTASPLTQAKVTLTFPQGSGLVLNLVDDKHPNDPGYSNALADYRWIIEEDRTFIHDPACQVNYDPTTQQAPTDSYGRACPPLPVEAVGYNFHSAGMPVVATGCTGVISCEQGQTLLGAPAVCDVSNGICRTDDIKRAPLNPRDVALDPTKHYFISVFPANGINPTLSGAGAPRCQDGTTPTSSSTCTLRPFNIALDCPNAASFMPPVPGGSPGTCGHNVGGAQIPPQSVQNGQLVARAPLTLQMVETPLPTAQISALVFEDDFPLNGENDSGGGVDVLAPNEPGLGGFEIVLLDQAGQLGDNVGQLTYNMFNMPLSNNLAGTIDPFTKQDACPISGANANGDGIVGRIVTCPKYEADGKTLSPLAGQAVIANLAPGLYEVQAYPAADRTARGEEWLQTNTLDGGKPHEAFIRPGEPRQFQEFGPGGFHVQIGFANPKIINDRRHNEAGTGLCDPAPQGGGLNCSFTLHGSVHGNHMSRTPDERTYDTGSYDAFSFSSCYVSIGIPDEQDIAFAKCNADGTFTVPNMPTGLYKVAVFDQWNDIMLDGLVSSVTVNAPTSGSDIYLNPLTVTQWRTNIYTRAYLDTLGGVSNGIPDRDGGQDLEAGLATIPMNIRYRDGSVAFKNTTNANGYAAFNEVFPLMAWLVVEPDSTRYKSTGVHVVYDAGGPADCSPIAKSLNRPCTTTGANLAGTVEVNSLPTDLRVPGAVYCTNADCLNEPLLPNGIQNGTYYAGANNGTSGATANLSSGRIDPPQKMEGWQGLLGQHSFIDFGMKPYAANETGGISGIVVYASTRPFDDPTRLVPNQWEPGVANVTVNLYQKVTAADGSTSLTLVDTVKTDSWDSWAQGFRTDGTGTGTLLQGSDSTATNPTYVPNMNCPGQDPQSGFFYTLQGSKMWLDTPDANGNKKQLAHNAQFKCFDGWAMLNQIQPATYDGHYQFPSVLDRDPKTGRPALLHANATVSNAKWATNCTICVPNPDDQNPMLPPGDYVVEVVPPQGFEVVKEEDKNILMGDAYIAPVTQQFAGLSAVFILPDQATLNAYYNANNPVNSTTNLGSPTLPISDLAMYEEQVWPCVGATRVVPDYNSLYPGAKQTAPFAGATRPLCDRKEVQLTYQMAANTKFFVFTKAHVAGHFYGVMSNDMASEFDPFSPAYGEKFGPPNLPVRMRNFSGDEVVRVYADQWGVYNGMYPSSWEVNPPTPSGYVPQMSIACMNDPGPIVDANGNAVTDPQYNPAYSNFCYEHPFLPGMTAYMDTPVTPVQAFADHYNLPDAEYPDGTPVIKRADFTNTNTSCKAVGGGTAACVGPWAPASQSVTSVSVRNSGSNYTSAPLVSFTGTGSGAAALAYLDVVGYTVKLNGVTLPTGNTNVTVTVTAPGCKSTVADLNGNTTACVTATATARINPGFGGRPATLTVTPAFGGNSAGVGYTSAPTVTLGGFTGAANVTVTPIMGVGLVVVTSGGSYSATPAVAFAGSGGASATANTATGAATGTLVLTAFGDRSVQNPMYAGPQATVAPYNTKTITRHYGFGALCTVDDVKNQRNNCVAASQVTVGGVVATLDASQSQPWSDGKIYVTVPAGVPACAVQQQGQPTALCGQVVITSGNGKQSIDAVTVTIGGKTPTIVTPGGPSDNSWGEPTPVPLQTAIDKAAPGDLLIVEAGTYRENLIMWKPVRLQGVGAGAVTINADAHPAEKLDAWRRRVACLFGLTIQGTPNAQNKQFDSSGQYKCPDNEYFRADRLPFEGFVGWDASSNGNLMQLLIEPSLMGAYEGAGVTVIGRGVNQSRVQGGDYWGMGQGGGAYASGSKYLSTDNIGLRLLANPWSGTECTTGLNRTTGQYTQIATVNDYGTGNFDCNPSQIDGLSIINSSQGGGGVFIHGWNHHLQVANNRIAANAGTYAGAINLGNGEIPPGFYNDGTLCGAAVASIALTTLCPPVPQALATDGHIPYRFEDQVHVHHNQLINNAAIGDALFSYVPSGSGGISISGGADHYEVDHNWIAANLTAGDGAGIAHMGFIDHGQIHNNFVLFNEANNPTLEVDGGGIIIMGAQEDRVLSNGQECGGTTDSDCPPGMSAGTGPGLVIDSNLILGNGAAYGSGGGIRLRQVNADEVGIFPTTPSQWYDVTLTNNIIVNNVAGWDGGGVSMQDALKVVVANNTIASNDTTASAGVLFKTMGAPMGASPPPGCIPTSNVFLPASASCPNGGNAPAYPQPAGLVTMQNTPNLMASMDKRWDDEAAAWVTISQIQCPAGYGYGTGDDSVNDRSLLNGRCLLAGIPNVVNTMFWQNRAFHVAIVTGATDANGQPVVATDQGTTTPTGASGSVDFKGSSASQQNIVALMPVLNQTATGSCAAPPPGQELYWDVGVRLDMWGTHNLVFNTTNVNAGYSLDGVASATVTNGQVTALTILDPGAGFRSTPTVIIDPPSCGPTTKNKATCVQATATATVVNGVITKLTVRIQGLGYTSAPNVTISGGGLTPNLNGANNNSPIAVGAKYSIFSDALNARFASGNNAADATNLYPGVTAWGIGSSDPVDGKYCNGARVPPEQCNAATQGSVNPLMCKGYLAPAGRSESPGVASVFVFNGISATATTDEGNNWINMVYGPLTLTRPPQNGAAVKGAEGIVATPAVAQASGVYTIYGPSAQRAASPAVDTGSATAQAYTGHDFFGNARGLGGGWDIGAMELVPQMVDIAVTSAGASSSLSVGSPLTLTLTVSNLSATTVPNVKVSDVVTALAAQLTAAPTWTCVAASAASSCAAASGSGNIATTVTLGANDSVTFTLSGTVKLPGTAVNTVTASVPAGFGDSNPANNTATQTLTVFGLSGPVSTYATLGSTSTIALTGGGLTGATAVNVSGGGVTCTILQNPAPTDSGLSARCTVPPAATTGAYALTVVTPSGTTNTLPFNVFGITQLSPNSASHPTTGTKTVALSITGGGLTGATGVTVSGNLMGCRIQGTPQTATTVTASCTITAPYTIFGRTTTPVGTHNVSVTVPNGGGTNTLPFTVN